MVMNKQHKGAFSLTWLHHHPPAAAVFMTGFSHSTLNSFDAETSAKQGVADQLSLTLIRKAHISSIRQQSPRKFSGF